VREWEKSFRPGDLVKAFPEIGGVRDVQVLSSSANGRIRTARVVGPRGALVVKGAELRQRLGLRSTWATFSFGGSGSPADGGAGPVALPVQVSGRSARTAPSGSGPVALTVVRADQPVPPARSRGGSSGGGRSMPRTSLSALLDAVASSGSSPRQASVQRSPRQEYRSGRRLPQRGPSAALVVRGRGFGHGVGMSQWGAYGLASRGEDYEDILRHFYRGAQLRPYPSL
jgi:stage II sporulation protein D